ncbi:MAG: hypothetical protein A2148_05710 [Chloroflexi bacterium RBG_16_68_14]|nr:MAG: hypothetical protein A2148_05710 [Chloroflexi bacterium RBG_16_68_14]
MLIATPRVENPRLTPLMPYYHVWFSPKNREAILEGAIAEITRAKLVEAAATRGITLVECEMGYDHVHMLLELHEGQALPSVMHLLKGISAHRVFEEVPELKIDLRHTSFWQRGYGYRKVGALELSRVRRYIRNHREVSEPRVFNPRGRSS